MEKYDLTIIIVTYNSEKYIRKCLSSIIASDLNKYKYSIVVFDNNSKDRSIDVVKKIIKNNKNILVIKNNKNIGFAKAVNYVISKNEFSKYFLLLNPDTIVEKESIKKTIECSKKFRAGIVGGSTLDIKGQESGSYFRFPNLMIGIFDFTNLRKLCIGDRWHKYFYYQDWIRFDDQSIPVDIVTGGFMLIKQSVIKKIGLFDESFFMYLEDVDYCFRAKVAKIKIFHSYQSKIIHIGGASSKNKDRIRHLSWLKSRKLYFIKHFGVLENLLIQPIFLIDDILILLSIGLKISLNSFILN